MIKKNYQLNRNERFIDKAQQCFAFLQIKTKFKFAANEVDSLKCLPLKLLNTAKIEAMFFSTWKRANPKNFFQRKVFISIDVMAQLNDSSPQNMRF